MDDAEMSLGAALPDVRAAGVRCDAPEGSGGEAAWSVRQGSGDNDQKSRDSACVLAPSHRIGASRLRTGGARSDRSLRTHAPPSRPEGSEATCEAALEA